MAFLQNSIGRFNFTGLTGTLSPPREIVSLDERPAVNGTELTKEGTKGRPFQVETWYDVASYAAARALGLEYRELIGGEPVELVKADVSSFLEGYSVAVLDVQYEATALAGSVGGLNPPAYGMVRAQWTLIAISN